MPRMDKVGATATQVHQGESDGFVKYHETIVCHWGPDKIQLDSGGWRTATTLRRMNQASRQFNLGFVVVQRKGEWFVSQGGRDYVPFENGMILDRTFRPAVDSLSQGGASA